MGVGGLENMFEIADRLMIMDGEGKFEFFHLITVCHFLFLRKAVKMKLKIQKEKLKNTNQNVKLPFHNFLSLLLRGTLPRNMHIHSYQFLVRGEGTPNQPFKSLKLTLPILLSILNFDL